VEDNEINQLVAHGVLRKLGFAVRIAGDGRQALTALDDADFDIVLMDCHMPVMAGFEATAQLRRREADQRPGARRAGQGRRTPVIAMTAGVVREDRDRCLAAGMDDFVAKPIKVEVLERTMARYLTAGGAPPPSVPRQSTAQREVPAAAAAAPQDGLDVTRLELLRQLDPDGTSGLLSVIVTAFLDDAPIRLDALRAAVAAGGGPPLTQPPTSSRLSRQPPRGVLTLSAGVAASYPDRRMPSSELVAEADTARCTKRSAPAATA